jgi:drug/metabolite transporter superfamily protein YnfA
MLISMTFEEFFAWLASHSTNEIVGQPGRCFHSPLAQFLSWKSGYVICEDGRRYGRSVVPDCRWLELPSWAQLFATLSERSFGRALSAYEAVCVLAEVEALFA